MSKIGKAFKSALAYFQFSTWDNPRQNGMNLFFPVKSTTFNDYALLKAFFEIPEVNAIINQKARAFAKMRITIESKTTGEEVKNYENLVKTLRSPNYFQSRNEFIRQSKIFREIFGEEFIYWKVPFGMEMTQVKGMFTLPPYLMEREVVDKRPFFLIDTPEFEYNFKWGNYKYPLEQRLVVHLNDNRIKMTEKDYISGESTLESLTAPLNNIRAAYESRNIILTHRGALGILSNDSRDVTGSVLPLDPESKRELQEEYRKYGLTGNQWQVILTNLSLKWQQMSIDPDKLGLYQEVREDTIKICDSFGFPFELLGNEKGVTFENQKWAERRLYENTIIPEAQEWIDAMNATLETEKRSWHIVGRFDHLPIFNENLKERAASISLMTNALSRQYADQAITLQQYQTELGKYKIGEL